MEEKTGYLIGSFAGDEWREEYIEQVSNIKWNDPRDHPQNSIKNLNGADFEEKGAKGSDVPLGHRRKNKLLGVTSYGEIGAARAHGKPIIITDLNEIKDPILEQVASYYFHSQNNAIDFLKNETPITKYPALTSKLRDTKSYEKIIFVGDVDPIEKTIFEASNFANIEIGKDISYLENFAINDLVVVNFEKNWNPAGVFYLGLSHALNVPTIILEGNKVAYPPLTGLAKRTFMGKNREKNFLNYLELNSLEEDTVGNFFGNFEDLVKNDHVKSTMNQFYRNLLNLETNDVTNTTNPCENIYVAGKNKAKMKRIFSKYKNVQERLSTNTDLVVVDYNPHSLKTMIKSHEMKIPILFLSKEETLYQSITELSRRPLTGRDRFKQAEYYIKNLKSQHIKDESLVYYLLMEKFNQ